jgi:stress response protein SCP2
MPLVPKGQSTLLSKEASAPSVKKFKAGAGWDPADGGSAVDLDLVAIKLSGGKGFDADGNGTSEVDEAVTYYGNMTTPGLKLDKDDRTGESSGDGPDETMDIDLEALEPAVDELLIVVGSYSGETFDQVKNVFASLSEGDKEVVRADLAAEHAGKKAVVVAKLTKQGDDWSFTHVGEGYDTVDAILSKYSIQ